MRPAPRGFTMVELLVVVVIIGVLAVVAIPRFVNSTEQGYAGTMKGDLRNLAVAQEAYFHRNSTYYDGPIPSPALTYDPTKDVTITLRHVSRRGWAATATHSGTAMKCTMFVGDAPVLPPARVVGEASCR
jgi:type IV pilus assembly protein PilA